MDAFQEEEKHLNDTLEIIDEEVERITKEINRLIDTGKRLSFEDRKRGEHFNVNAQAGLLSDTKSSLIKSKPVPYFGRMDIAFNETGKNARPIYIGRSGIYHNSSLIVTDWRAPISSVYYDSEEGKITYTAPEGQVDAYLALKRQINIKNSKLESVQDSSLVTSDELLRPYLEQSADNKMKTIIASIQKEQNDIIRKPLNTNLITQGVAGSGKTSVALHRIAYLAYTLEKKSVEDIFLVLGPNDYFLNYVSSVLPDLDTRSVNEETFLNYAREYTKDKINLRPESNTDKTVSEEEYRKIQSFKTSLEYKKLLDEFIKYYIRDYIVEDDFKIKDEVVFTKETVKDCLFSMNKEFPNYERLTMLLINTIKNDYEKIYQGLNAKYKKIYMSMDYHDPERRKYVDYSSSLYNAIKNDGPKLIRKYVKDIEKSSLEIYSLFMKYIDSVDCSLSQKEKLLLEKLTLNDLKKKKVGFEDLPALIHISYRLSNKANKYKQVVIDEAQDYGLFHFDVLKETNPNSVFSIYGDLAQSIYSYRSINNWEEVIENIFNNNAELLHLSKSYRTTKEITENANSILNSLNLEEAMPVIRHGLEVDYNDSSYNPEYKITKLKEMISKNYSTIAIICKDDHEVNKVSKELKNANIDAKIISDKDMKYEGGLFILTASSAKGLEFDGVIINDASEQNYDSTSDVDMHLLYVASTRALHELNINYNKTLSKAFSTTPCKTHPMIKQLKKNN